MTSEYITQIETENEALKKRVFELDESLKKYKSTHRQKKYYENHADDVIQKGKRNQSRQSQGMEPNRLSKT